MEHDPADAGLVAREESGTVTVLRLRHGKVNALDLELVEALSSELAAVDRAGAVVLTGSGGVFSAGVDLVRFLAEDRAYLERFFVAFDRLLRRLASLPRPVVAAVDGHALAGGWILACCADYRIAATGPATIGVTELRVGIPFPEVALAAVVGATPRHLLEPMLYLAEPMPIADAARHGLVHELVPPQDLVPRAVEVATRLAAVEPVAYARTKRALRGELPSSDLQDTIEVWDRPESRAAVERFLTALRHR